MSSIPESVIVVGGGQNEEHEVSLASAAAVADALQDAGYLVDPVTIGRDGIWRLGEQVLGQTPADSLTAVLPALGHADVLFPAVHGPLGEDGTLAALCALTHTRLVGSDLRAGAIGMDKGLTKLVAESVGVRTAPGRVIAAAEIGEIEFEGDVVVKPVSSGSSYGVSLAQDAAQLSDALRTAARFDRRILIESVVQAREIDVAVIREADGSCWSPPPLEIHASGVFDTDMKYDGTAQFTVPAVLTTHERTALVRAARTVFDALGCRGVARMDFFLTADGPVLNEVNTMPGMTAFSQVPRMFAAAGVDYPELITRLVQGAAVPGPVRQEALRGTT